MRHQTKHTVQQLTEAMQKVTASSLDDETKRLVLYTLTTDINRRAKAGWRNRPKKEEKDND
jgi:hypothetical protein